MLAKKYKVPGRYRIQRIFEKGRKVSGSLFSLRYYVLRHGQKNHGFRFAVIMPTKLKIKTVMRNRIRRRLYEAIRKSLFEKTIDKTDGKRYAFCCSDIVLVAHTTKIATMPFEKLAHEFLRLLAACRD